MRYPQGEAADSFDRPGPIGGFSTELPDQSQRVSQGIPDAGVGLRVLTDRIPAKGLDLRETGSQQTRRNIDRVNRRSQLVRVAGSATFAYQTNGGSQSNGKLRVPGHLCRPGWGGW